MLPAMVLKTSSESSNTRAKTDTRMSEQNQPPDHVAHQLVTNCGSPVRLCLKDETLTVPTEPYRRGTPATVSRSVESFDAVIERADVVDGGLNVASFHGIHLPATEWERIGLGDHWEHDDVDLRDPLTDLNRRMELWASREDELYDTAPEQYQFDHLDPLPDDSPLITSWVPHDDGPEKPPVPLSYPTLRTDVVHAEDAKIYTSGFDQIELGTVVAVEILDRIDEWPEEPDIEQREVDIDHSPPPRHPNAQFAEIEPLAHTEEILTAVYTINRHAKRLGEAADTAYQLNEGANARVYALQKKALYKVKTVAVHRLVKGDPEQTDVALHDLNGENKLYCFRFSENRSFHQPMAAVEDAALERVGADELQEAKRIDFQPTTETQQLDMALETALRTLADHGINANDHLDATSVLEYEWNHEIPTTFDCIGTNN